MSAPKECSGCGRELVSFAVQPHDVSACRRAHGEPIRGLIRSLEEQWSEASFPPLPSRVARRLKREKEILAKRGRAA